MKIAFFTDQSLPYINGVSTSLDTITTALAQRGHTVVIFAPKPGKKRGLVKPIDGITYVYTPSFPALIYPDIRVGAPVSPRIVKITKELDPDIIHVQTPYLIGAMGVVLGKILKKPVLGSFHGYFMEPEYLGALGIHDQMELLTNFLWKYVVMLYNQCQRVHTPALFTKNDLLQHGINKPIHVIPNSINDAKVDRIGKKSIDTLKKTYSLKKNVLLYVGRLSPEKNIEFLIHSFARLSRQMETVSLFLVGDGPSKKTLKALCRELKITKNVIFAGEVPYHILLTSGFFQAADVFVTPSTSELQPVSLIEAMYFKLPIVGVKKRGVEEMIQNVGLLVKPDTIKGFADALAKTLTDKKMRQQLSKNSYITFCNTYALPQVIQQYEKLYEEMRTRRKR